MLTSPQLYTIIYDFIPLRILSKDSKEAPILAPGVLYMQHDILYLSHIQLKLFAGSRSIS